MPALIPPDGPNDLTRITLGVLFITGLLYASFSVVQPFLPATVWATTLVIATWPLLLQTQRLCFGSRGLAVAVMTLVLLLLFVVPMWLAISTIVAQSDRIIALGTALTDFHMPEHPAWMADIPLVGDRLVDLWHQAQSVDAHDIVAQASPYAGSVTRWFVGAVGSLGGLFVQFLLTVLIAAILYMNGEAAGNMMCHFGERLGGPRGGQTVVLAAGAVRGVALGVVVTAIAQCVLGGIGLAATGVPQAGVLTAVMFMICLAQLGPGPVLIPATIWMYSAHGSLSGTILLVFTLVALGMDNVLRPILIQRGANLPLMLVLTGVIGGLLGFGLVGIFLGPVVLAVGYTLLRAWMDDAPQVG